MAALTFRSLIICAISILALPRIVTASSTPNPPLHHVEHPVVQSLQVFPRHGAPVDRRDVRELHHSDSFRLSLSAFDQTFHLHLKPNDELVHPAARINYYRPGPDGASELYRTEPLLREDVRAYAGEVVADEDAPRRLLEDAAGGGLRSPAPAPALGWARIVVHASGPDAPPHFEGAFSVNGDVHHVATTDNYLRRMRPGDPHPAPPADADDSHLVVFRSSDMYHADDARPAASCAHDSLPYNVDPRLNPALRAPIAPPPWYDPLDLWSSANGSIARRTDIGNDGVAGNNFINSIGQTDGCPKTPKILYMGVAADCTYVSNYGSTQNATSAILNDWNAATGKYKSTFNVSLGIVTLDVHDPQCPTVAPSDAKWNVACQSSITLNDRLSLFSEWRGDRKGDGIGLWHLMSGCPTGTEVGVAWLSTLCQDASSGAAPNIVSGTAVSTFGPTEWEVVTHEIGHNFGAIHDCTDGCSLTDNCCPSTKTQCSSPNAFIMNPTSSPSETQFSQCTIGNICTSLKSAVSTTCLQDVGASTTKTITFQMCGNGIVEDGEDCDPGQGVSSSCCDSQTCKFRTNAVCDPASSPCCTSQCAFSSAGTVCRPAMDQQCDIAETCSGTSANCPADQTRPNGQVCGSESGEQLTCASGICTSVGQQCRLMGASLNLTRACTQQANAGCQVACQDPTRSDRCLVLQATLPNGSKCGYGGMCTNGNCQAGSLLDTAKAWFVQNLQIGIPIAVVAGIIALLLLWVLISMIRRHCCLGRREPPAAQYTRNVPSGSGRRPDSQEGLIAATAVVETQQHYGQLSRPPPIHTSGPAGLYPGRQQQPQHGRSRSAANPFEARDGPMPRSPSADAFPRRERVRWVDDTLYNGPRRQ